MLQIVQKDRASKAKQGEGIRVQQRTERRARGLQMEVDLQMRAYP
jgi:hypothetical protein